MNLYALHGFLGSPDDWQMLATLPVRLQTPDLFTMTDKVSISQWAADFNRGIEAQSPGHVDNVLVGYSMGGRLALNALIDRPALWKGAVIVSAHPGLSSLAEKEERVEFDRRWAERIVGEEWHEWIADWNAQGIFQYDRPKNILQQPKERCYRMALGLQNWSLGRQNDLSSAIAALDLPILWVVGQRDEKFIRVANRLRFRHPHSKVIEIEGAGHRVPWSNPEQFNEHITQFIHLLEGNK